MLREKLLSDENENKTVARHTMLQTSIMSGRGLDVDSLSQPVGGIYWKAFTKETLHEHRIFVIVVPVG